MIIAIILLAHFSACIWLILGLQQEDSWIRKSEQYSAYT